MALNEKSTQVTWPRSHYLYVEKRGPFMKTAPAAWQELHQHRSELEKLGNIIGYSSLYLIEPEMVYRAGIFLSEAPAKNSNRIVAHHL